MSKGQSKLSCKGPNFRRFRPKVVLVEALAPYTLSPSWPAWEPLLLPQGYQFAFFDGLNRYYVANEEMSLLDRFPAEPLPSDGFVQFGILESALGEKRHPDQQLANLLAKALLTKLPLLDREAVFELLTYNVSTEDLRKLATQAEIASAWVRLFGDALPPPTMADLSPQPSA